MICVWYGGSVEVPVVRNSLLCFQKKLFDNLNGQSISSNGIIGKPWAMLVEDQSELFLNRFSLLGTLLASYSERDKEQHGLFQSSSGFYRQQDGLLCMSPA